MLVHVANQKSNSICRGRSARRRNSMKFPVASVNSWEKAPRQHRSVRPCRNVFEIKCRKGTSHVRANSPAMIRGCPKKRRVRMASKFSQVEGSTSAEGVRSSEARWVGRWQKTPETTLCRAILRLSAMLLGTSRLGTSMSDHDCHSGERDVN